MLRREHLPHVLGAFTLAVMFSAASVHPQATTDPSGSAGSGATAPSTTAPASGGSSGATGQAGSSAGGTAPAAGSASATTGAADKAAAKLSKADRGMMRDIAYANISEIEAGKLAQSKTKNEQVKTFAQKMIDDHTKAQSEVQQLAQAKGVTLPTQSDSKHKAAVKKMSALSDDAFDRAYMTQAGVNDHKQTRNLLNRVKSKATDPDLKALADKMLPTVDEHLAMAQQMKGGKASAPAVSGSSGASGSSSGAPRSGDSSGTGSSGGGQGK